MDEMEIGCLDKLSTAKNELREEIKNAVSEQRRYDVIEVHNATFWCT